MRKSTVLLIYAMLLIVAVVGGCEWIEVNLRDNPFQQDEPPPPDMDCPEIVSIDSQAMHGTYFTILGGISYDSFAIKEYAGMEWDLVCGRADTFAANAEIVSAIRDVFDAEGISYGQIRIAANNDSVGFGYNIYTSNYNGPEGRLKIQFYGSSRSYWYMDQIDDDHAGLDVAKRSSGIYVAPAGYGRFYVNVSGRGNYEVIRAFLEGVEGNVIGFNFLNTEYTEAQYDTLTDLILSDCKGRGYRADLRGTGVSDSLFNEREWQIVVQ